MQSESATTAVHRYIRVLIQNLFHEGKRPVLGD